MQPFAVRAAAATRRLLCSQCIDAASCYRCSVVCVRVCVCVCLLATTIHELCAKTAKLIKMPFGCGLAYGHKKPCIRPIGEDKFK